MEHLISRQDRFSLQSFLLKSLVISPGTKVALSGIEKNSYSQNFIIIIVLQLKFVPLENITIPENSASLEILTIPKQIQKHPDCRDKALRKTSSFTFKTCWSHQSALWRHPFLLSPQLKKQNLSHSQDLDPLATPQQIGIRKNLLPQKLNKRSPFIIIQCRLKDSKAST